jgi:hypothetical protein
MDFKNCFQAGLLIQLVFVSDEARFTLSGSASRQITDIGILQMAMHAYVFLKKQRVSI